MPVPTPARREIEILSNACFSSRICGNPGYTCLVSRFPRRLPITALTRPTEQQRVEEARLHATQIATLLADTRCSNVRILDMSKLSPVCDMFVLATGTSARQMRSVADDVAEYAADHGLRVLSNSG